MSLLYKDEKDLKYRVTITDLGDGVLNIDFEADFGKHGTFEGVADFNITPKRLLELLKTEEGVRNLGLDDLLKRKGYIC